ncbi:RLF protein, partial [Polyodon spathula]|nr:RLF protein [Polyodon spathula]
MLVQYAGSRNAQEHGLSLLEVYRLSIQSFALARPHLTTECENVLLVLGRLALSCFELLLSVPENEIPYEVWLQFHQSVLGAHKALLEFGNGVLLTLLEITSEGGAWRNPVLLKILTQQPTEPEDVSKFIAREGPAFLEMRIKHLIKTNNVPQAMLLAKLCAESVEIANKTPFRQVYISHLCDMLPSEEAIQEISNVDCKEILDMVCNLEAEGQENTAFILCTTYLTQQLQKENMYCSWELTLFWSKLQRRIDPSLESFLDRCRRLGVIAKTAYHLLFLVRVIQTETEELGLAVSVELCVRALQIPSQDNADTKMSVCKMIACLLPDDLEVRRGCQLTEFLLGPTQEAYNLLEELYLKPDQKYDEGNSIVPISLRCEVLLALKAHWPFDPEFWDWKTLKRNCLKRLGVEPLDESGEEELHEQQANDQGESLAHQSHSGESFLSDKEEEKEQQQVTPAQTGWKRKKKEVGTSERYKRWLQYKFCCVICSREVIEARILHHAKTHMVNGVFTCPICLQKFEGKHKFVPHLTEHVRMPARRNQPKKKIGKKKKVKKVETMEEDMEELGEVGMEELELGEIKIDRSTLEDEALQTSRTPAESDYITFSYIADNFELRDRDIYPCPATDCLRLFKHFKYLSVHLKAEHPESDDNARHYLEMKDRREKCTFCRRHFLTPFHHRQHRRVHYGKLPYMCVAAGCGARFNSTNQLVAHKQAHGYQLSYQCELKGCSLTFSDLGQLYHHEAQHFRDAAYNCIHPSCKKFYYSKKEFAKHLASHGLTFSEDNLMSYRKVKQEFEAPLGESVVGPVEGSKAENTDVPKPILEELMNGIKTETPDFSQLVENPTTPAPVPAASELLTGTLTSVAVCFDGKKFTCGFEGCGLTFIQARDIQRHLKNVHPLQFKRHKKGEKTKKMCKKSRLHQSRKPLRFQEHSSGSHSSSLPDPELGHSDPLSTEIDSPNPVETQPSSSNEESLIEILARLSQLSLKTPIIAASSLTSHSFLGSSITQVTLPSTTGANPPTKPTDKKAVLKSQPPQSGYKKELPAATAEGPSASPLPPPLPSQHNKQVSQFLVQASNKPYFCELKDCKYRSVARAALLVHYLKKHSMSKDKVMGMEMFHRKFKPFACHLCPSAFTRKSQLRLHLMSQHKLSKTLVAQMSCSKKRRGDRDRNDAEKVPDSYASGVSLDRELPEKGQQKKEASNWGKKIKKRRRVGVCSTEFEKRLQDREEELEEEETDVKATSPAIEDNEEEEEEAREGRGSRRLMAKGSLCYILSKYNKPFECVHKGCSSAFTNQNGLIRHLRLVHRYNRDQLCMEGGQRQGGGAKKDRNCSKRIRSLSALARHSEESRRPKREESPEPEESPEAQTLASEEPVPQFSCSYSDCTASYHLYSSLLRHQRLLHSDQTLQPCSKRTRTKLRCTYEGCTRVFSHRNTYEQHVFFMHRNNYDSFVLRLQNEKEEDRNKGASGCQKKLISVIATPSPSLSPPLQSPPRQGKGSTKKKFLTKGNLLLRTPEEALQMCEDRNIPVAYPCMVQDCESVVTLESSLIRHYKRCHNIRHTYLGKHYDKLVNNAEKLEETIQKNSTPSVPTLLDKPVSVEYQKELKNPLASKLPVSLPSIKSSLDEQDHLGFGEEISENDFTLDADDLLYGEAVKKSRCYSSNGGQPRRNGYGFEKKPEPPPPPQTLLCFSREDGFLDLTCKGGGKGTGTFSSVSRPPLKRKNEQADPLLAAKENYQCPRNLHNRSPTPRTFDLKTYKPMGFESSFLKFIQESESKDEVFEESLPEPQVVIKRRDVHRRGCSVKENSQRRLGRNKNGSLVHGKLSAFQPLLSAEESATVQNLRSILDKALTDCGDLALKQLHYLKPVVVLERSKFSTSLLDLFPTKKADELCLASS